MSQPVVTLGFEEPRDLVARLLQDEACWPPDPRAWFFRGHANSKWPLLPTALRANVRLEPHARPTRSGVRRSHGEQVLAEWRLLRRFFDRMDAARIAIPEDSQVHRSRQGVEWWESYLRDVLSGEQAWPVMDLRTLSAVAQHYGVPTRLLDWSKSPLVAAYFAAREAAQWVASGRVSSRRNQLLCVWAICAHDLALVRREGVAHTIEIVSAPTALIPNLALQHGVFTVDLHEQNETDCVCRRSLDRLVSDVAARRAHPVHPMLVQLTLPAIHAPELLRRLAWHGVDATAVNAGHLGAAEAVTERALWDVADMVGPIDSY